jgi:hypothetical protein
MYGRAGFHLLRQRVFLAVWAPIQHGNYGRAQLGCHTYEVANDLLLTPSFLLGRRLHFGILILDLAQVARIVYFAARRSDPPFSSTPAQRGGADVYVLSTCEVRTRHPSQKSLGIIDYRFQVGCRLERFLDR